jgi:ADP-ribose pyrophosphatase
MIHSDPLTGKTIETRRIYDGDRISLRKDVFRLGDKPAVSKEIIDHPGSVVLVPVTTSGTILFIRQWRQPAGRVILELPSGTREPGEDHAETARRELREETGYSAQHFTYLGASWVAPGYSTEYTHAYLATGLRHDPLPQDDGEDIHVAEVKIADVLRLVKTGELEDQMSIAAYYVAAHLFKKELKNQ